MPPNQLMEVLAQMKVLDLLVVVKCNCVNVIDRQAFVITHPEHARILLVKQPQLAYALFQALLLNKIVDSAILERMLATSRAPGGPPPAQTQIPPTARAPIPPHQQPPSHYPSHMPPFPPTGLQHSPAMPMNAPPASAMFSHQQPQHLSHQPPPAMPPMSAQMYRPPQPPATQPQPTPAKQQPALAPEISETQRVCCLFLSVIYFLVIYSSRRC